MLKHDPTKHSVILTSGVAGILPIYIVGHEVDDWVMVADENPRMEADNSGDGQITFNKTANPLASITLKLKQNSLSADQIASFVLAHDTANVSIASIVYTNANTERVHTLSGCELEKLPDESGGSKNGTLEYKFLASKKETQSLGGIINQGLQLLANGLNLG